jgi:hypothetical protein
MATACLFLGFDAPRPGREQEAFPHLMGPMLTQLDGFKKEGWFEAYEAFGLTPHSGNLNMGVLIQGERAKLDELRRTDRFERFSMELNRLFTGYGVIPGVTLAGMRKVADRNADLLK